MNTEDLLAAWHVASLKRQEAQRALHRRPDGPQPVGPCTEDGYLDYTPASEEWEEARAAVEVLRQEEGRVFDEYRRSRGDIVPERPWT